MTKAYREVARLAAAKKRDFKQAAYQVAVERVARAEALRGI